MKFSRCYLFYKISRGYLTLEEIQDFLNLHGHFGWFHWSIKNVETCRTWKQRCLTFQSSLWLLMAWHLQVLEHPQVMTKFVSHESMGLVLPLINSLRPRQNGCQFPDDIFKCIFLTENVKISIKISLKFVPKGSINNIPTLVQIMAWRRPGDKPLSEPMMVRLSTYICITRPQ